jgi:mono/diheme cytochrome c family protein
MFGPCDAARKLIASRPVLSEQRRGEALFVQNCSLCHSPSHQKQALGIQGPILKGMFGEDADEDFLRPFIQQGVSGFRFDLEPNQIDDIIAYLKRART